MISHRRRESQHDIKFSGQFSDARTLDWRKINNYRLTGFGIFNVFQDAIAFIEWFALYVTLRRPLFAALHFDRIMDMSRTPGIGHWLNRAKIVFAGRTGHEPAEALEVSIAVRLILVRVKIEYVIVHLPDLNQCISDWIAAPIQNAARKVRYLAHSPCQ